MNCVKILKHAYFYEVLAMCREIENNGITTENEKKSNKVSLLTFGDFSRHGSVEKCSVAGQ